uniref:F-box domain-containing protein n=2 Tax=Aegilops tauschii TaxID=37682 RepID=A0A453CX79_AEGTS
MAPDTPTAAKRSKQAPCTAASLPEEILSEILLLLPSRYILRFRAVCRSWAALLSSPAFKDVYAVKAHARARRMDKFVVFAPSPNANGSMAVYSCARGASVADPLLTVDRVRVDFMCLSSKPCHGTMLFSDTRSGVYWVCNPSTGECVPLPKQRRGLMESSAGLVYDDRTKERKVVHLFKDMTHFGCDIYALCNPTQQWRPANQDVQLLGFNILKFVLGTEDSVTKVPPVFANGCLHWLAYPAYMDTPDGQDAILCFSVDTETFTRLNAPSSVHLAAEYKELDENLPAVPMHLAELEGSLCLVHDLRGRGQGRSWLDVWMLRDHVANEWSLDYRIVVTPLLARDVHSPRFITVLGSSSDGDSCAGNEQEKKKILIATSQHQVHAYDPKEGDIQLVFSAPKTNIRIGQKEAAAALWLGLYEDNVVQVEGANRRDKEVLSAVTKILARLPVKSIAHSMLVCRQWRSLIESESFIISHMSMKRPKRILMASNGRARRAFFEFTSVGNWLQAASPALADTLVNDKVMCSKPCHGLNLISTNTDDFLCNPCTGAIKCLGRHGKSHFTSAGHQRRHAFSVGRNIGFGFDQSTGEHVAVEIGYINGTLACVIKTSSEKQWTCIGKPPRMVSDMPPAHVDGTLYWTSEPGHERVIVALDISTREFNILPCEPSLKNDRRHAFLVELKGMLSLVAVDASAGEMVIWTMPKNMSSWVGAYKICLDEHPDYSLAKGQVVMPVEIDDGNDGRILLNTGRALGYYDAKTGELDSMYSLDQLKLPRSSLAFPVLCQESLARIQDDELPIRVAPSVCDEGCRPCEHPDHADTTLGQGRLLLLKCEADACLDVGDVYRSCCRRLLCWSCQSRCIEHCQTQTFALRPDPVLPTHGPNLVWNRLGPDASLPFCHPSVPGPEYCYYFPIVEGDVVRHVFMSIRDYIQGKQWCRFAECGYRTEGDAVKETWVRRYLKP